MVYFPEGFDSQTETAERSANDIVDAIVLAWRQCELVSVEDALHPGDLVGLRLLKEKVRAAAHC